MTTQTHSQPWVRNKDGILAGVCAAIARRFQLDVMLVRLALIFSALFFGVGIGLYIFCAIGLPREDRLNKAYEPRLFGVCSRFARRFDLDLGFTRTAAVLLLFCTGGTVFLIYLVLYFVLPKYDGLGQISEGLHNS